jgi:phage tail sheath protein FI
MLQAYVRRRRAFLIADCDEGATAATIAASLKGKTGADAPNSALYFPWVVASDLTSGATRAYPPCGFIAGLYARIDRERGVWKAPAGSGALLTGALGLSVNITDAESSALNPLGINCLRSFPSTGPVVWGARTLAAADGASEWKYVPVQRLAIYIEQSVAAGTQWAVFEPNNATLWATLRRSVDTFMNSLYRQGAFQGTTLAQAYVVKCDAATTTEADIERGVANIVIGFAPEKPAEFVVITIARLAATGTEYRG